MAKLSIGESKTEQSARDRLTSGNILYRQEGVSTEGKPPIIFPFPFKCAQTPVTQCANIWSEVTLVARRILHTTQCLVAGVTLVHVRCRVR